MKDNDFCWRPDVHGAEFDALKSLLVNAPVLAYFDTTKKITVQCDASHTGGPWICDNAGWTTG